MFNAEEEILVHEIDYRNDSIFIQMPFFEGLIAAKINKIGFKGLFIQESLERAIPIKAERGIKERFTLKRKSKPIDVSGTWEVRFSGGSDDKVYMGKGIFEQSGNHLTGTLRTSTGDYRYLDGVIDGSIFK